MHRLLALVLVGLIAAGVGALATGRVAYVTTSGVSMEPTYSAGDLVVVVPDDGYEVGDSVAYTDPGTGATVLHRIVGGDAESGFRLRGDNNQSIDPHEPTAADLAGRAVAHVPQVGAALGSPITKGLLLATVVALLASLLVPSSTGKTARSDRRRRRFRSSTSQPHPPGRNTRTLAEHAHTAPNTRTRTFLRARTAWMAMLVLDAVLIAALVAAYATRPDDPGEPEDQEQPTAEQRIALGYEAVVPRSETYPDARIRTGDTVFRSLVDAVEVSAELSSDAPDTVTGWAQLDVVASSSAGWSRTVTLAGPTDYTDDLDLAAELDLRRFEGLADRIEAETGVSAGTVDLTVRLHGEAALAGGEPADLDATMAFRLTGQTLTPSGDPDPDAADEAGAVTSTVELPHEPAPTGAVNEGGPDLTRVALVALLLAAGVTAVLWPTRDEPAEEPVLRIHADAVQRSSAATSIEVGDAAELEAIAHRTGAPVLWRDDGWAGVLHDDVLYWTAPVALPLVSRNGNGRHRVDDEARNGTPVAG